VIQRSGGAKTAVVYSAWSLLGEGIGVLESEALARRVVEIAEDRQASDIALLDIRPISILADFFVICSAGSERQIKAVTEAIQRTIQEEAATRPLHVEGTTDSGWVLLDYGSVIVHVFSPAQREYYRLEELWSQGVPVVHIL